MKPPAAYHELVRIHQSIALLSSTKSLLEWDEETTMPEGGALHRSRQVAELAGRIHQELVDPKVAELLAIVAESDLVRDATGAPAVNVRHWKRQVDRTARLDRALVEETAAAVSLSQRVWVGARQADDYATFLPHLTKVIDLKRREARAIASSEEREPWNALLFDYCLLYTSDAADE